ncbi:MAG: hypothetical protein QNK37_02640 [Acidobacteriota bacterium]|nr:hypothetical protein [Acidobacteriota bacterium]
MVRQKPKPWYTLFFARYPVGIDEFEIGRVSRDDRRRVNEDIHRAAADHSLHPVNMLEPYRPGYRTACEVRRP